MMSTNINNNAFIELDREVTETSQNNIMKPVFKKCFACERLEKGEGGENQLEHMEPGGCLFSEDLFIETKECYKSVSIEAKKYDKINKHNKICIICKLRSQNFTNDTYICDSCDTKEEKRRNTNYQNFVVNF